MINKRLTEMKMDEKYAPGKYKQLLKTLKRKQDKKVVLGIIHQERQHLRKLRKFK